MDREPEDNRVWSRLNFKWMDGKFLCVGIDPDTNKLPKHLQAKPKEAVFEFGRQIVDTTKEVAIAYKLNLAYFLTHHLTNEAHYGIRDLLRLIQYIKTATSAVVILDDKSGDVAASMEHRAYMAFNQFQAQALTVNPYVGLEPFTELLDTENSLFLVLCKTSNLGSGRYQDLILENGQRLYEYVAADVARQWNTHHSCGLVVGATYPEALRQVRQLAGPDMPILVPGISQPGVDLRQVLDGGLNEMGTGLVLSSSRQIIYASEGRDFAQAAGRAAQKLDAQIRQIVAEIRPNAQRWEYGEEE